MTEVEIKKYIDEHLDDWLFNEKNNHMNLDIEEMAHSLNQDVSVCQDRCASISTFLDSGCGDEISDGIRRDLYDQSHVIWKWLKYGIEMDTLYLRFSSLPYGVTGVTIHSSDRKRRICNGYTVVLSRLQSPFYVTNAYPVYIDSCT